MGGPAEKIHTEGVHHVTFVGADRQTSIDFWEGVLGMPLVFEQPNLDEPSESHLFFDSGDGRLITVFTNETWTPDARHNPTATGNLHHLAFTVSRATFDEAERRLRARRIASSGRVDRGFMHSLYFRDPLGQLLELASYKFEPPPGRSHVDVLRKAHEIRCRSGDGHIAEHHVAAAVKALSQQTEA